jgi:putative MATE family efflux protein
MGSALRGTGIVKPAITVQILTVLLNIVLAPVLIAGWGTGHALGVAGAGLASSLAVAAGVLLMGSYYARLESYVGFHPQLWQPRLATWRRMLAIGLPAGAEFALMFVVVAVVYSIIRDFGAAAQAGFGIGARVMQSIFLPAMAVAFATAPIAGQNFGARRPDRVRATFRHAVLTSSLIMLSLTLLCQLAPEALIGAFAQDEEVVEFGATYLRILSWNFVASGIIFTCAGMFQGLGNTAPALLSSLGRLLSFVFPALWLSHQEGFRIEQVWYVSVASVALQALCSVALLLQQMRRRLSPFENP